MLLNDRGKVSLALVSIRQKWVLQQLSCIWSVIRILDETSRYKALELITPFRIDRRWFSSHNVENNLLLVLLNIGRIPVCKFICKNTEWPNIDLAVVFLLPLNKLWRHPTNSADPTRSMFSFSRELGRVSKIGQLYVSLAIRQNVVWFDVSVNDMSRMQHMQTQQDLPKNPFTGFFAVIALKIWDDGRDGIFH